MRSFKGILAGSASVIALLGIGVPANAEDQQNAESIVVTGFRGSLQQSIDIKKNSNAIVDAVSAEDIGKFPDKNVADALARVPGVNTVSAAAGEGGFDERDRVSIRGTNPSLTQTTVDGHPISTGDWFILDQFQTVGRSISFTLLPSEIVSTAVVYKSQTADLPEGGVAGVVDVHTRRPLDFDKPLTFEAQGQAVYSDLPDKWEPQLNALASWKNENDTFGILLQGFYEKRDVRRDGQEFLGYSTTTVNGQAVAIPSLIGSALFEQKRKREGGDVAVQFRPNGQFEFVATGFYSKLDADNFNSNMLAWLSNEVGSGNVVLNPIIRGNTLVAGTFPLINPHTGNPVAGVVEDSIYRPGAGSSTWFIDLDGNWKPNDDWNFHGKAGWTRGEGVTPSQPTWESLALTGVSYDMRHGVAAVSFPDIDPTNPGDFQNDWAWSDKFNAVDKEFYAQADGERMINAGHFDSVKFGVRYNDHKRTVIGFDRGTCFFACPGASSSLVSDGQYPDDFADAFKIHGMLTDIWLADPHKIQMLVMPHVTPYVGPDGNFFYWPGSFAVQEKDWAGYVMANFSGDRWKGNIGLRGVRTRESVTEYVSNPATGIPDAYGAYSIANVDHTYTDVLPSANVSFDLRDDMILRLAAARVMSRADYSALGGAVALNDTIHTGTGGNPDLKPIRAWQYDASWEWYFAPQSLVSVGVFYMDLTSFVTFGTHNAVYLDATATGQQHHDVFATYAITSPTNTSGHDQGFELSWQQPIWGGFGIITNFTYADGEESGGGPLVGDAKNTFNVTGYFENSLLSARLSYSYRSKFLVGLDRSFAENQASSKSLDASVNVNVTDNIAVTFDALNLTDETLKYYGNSTVQPRAFYDNGRQYFIGVRVRM